MPAEAVEAGGIRLPGAPNVFSFVDRLSVRSRPFRRHRIDQGLWRQSEVGLRTWMFWIFLFFVFFIFIEVLAVY